MRPHFLSAELDTIVGLSSSVWNELRGSKVFITGGTGYYGSWLLKSLVQAEILFGLELEIMILSRNPDRFHSDHPLFRGFKFLNFVQGDVRSFDFPEGKFTHVIHAATESSEKLNKENPLLMIDTIVEGTRRVLEFAVHSGARHFLHTSSGAVYGDIPSGVMHVPETFTGGPDISKPKWAYGEGKRLAELLCCIYGEKYDISVKNARCFATIGPGLPLDTHFAIGNFIADAIAGRDIVIRGDGTPVRSYIDVRDLVNWLLHILVFGKSGDAYNVGSEEGFSLLEVAETVRNVLSPKLEIKVLKKPILQQLASYYVPSTCKANKKLGLKHDFTLIESIKNTASFSTENNSYLIAAK